MLFHICFVTAAFLGWSVQWNSPQRGENATPWGEALRRHGSQIVIGVLWTALVAWLDAAFLWWLAPIVVSLILSAPVSVITSRTGLGLAATGTAGDRSEEHTSELPSLMRISYAVFCL